MGADSVALSPGTAATPARPLVLAVVGPTASGKSSLGLDLAAAFGGEIINCDSTAVYRGFDIGTDKLPQRERRGMPHHLIDVADPTEVYTAARFAADAAAVIRSVHGRGRLPILVGGTGLYYRALVRGLFPGPGADDVLRARLTRVAERRGPGRLHRILTGVDPAAAARIMPADRKKVIRALEVYFLTGIAAQRAPGRRRCRRLPTARCSPWRWRCPRSRRPRAWRGASISSSSAASSARCGACSRPGCRARRGRSVGWCIGR